MSVKKKFQKKARKKSQKLKKALDLQAVSRRTLSIAQMIRLMPLVLVLKQQQKLTKTKTYKDGEHKEPGAKQLKNAVKKKDTRTDAHQMTDAKVFVLR